MKTQPMNFVFYMPDSMRAESLACYGHPLVQTPNFDALAHDGTLFENCYAQYPICGPSRCSMFTGWYPHVTGCRTNEFFLHRHHPSLWRYLKKAGWHVAWFGKNDFCPPEDIHLHASESKKPYNRAVEKTQAGAPVAAFGETGQYNFLCGAQSDGETSDTLILAQAQEFLRRKRQKDDPPFALFLPGGELVHPPYFTQEPFHSMYHPQDVPTLRPPGLPDEPPYRKLLSEYHEWDKGGDELHRAINAVYLGMVSRSDMLFGKLMATLADTGLDESTAVFVFSDHGDFAGDYGLGHKTWAALEDVMLRVPLIARIPGAARSHRVSEPVELFDLMATVLDLAGVQATHHHFARSLVPQLQGAFGDPMRIVYAEGGQPRGEPHNLDPHYGDGILIRETRCVYHAMARMQQDHPEYFWPSAMVRTNKEKLIYRPHGGSELYDMCNDSRELVNLYHDPMHKGLRDELEKKLLHWYMETSDVTPFERDGRGMRNVRNRCNYSGRLP